MPAGPVAYRSGEIMNRIELQWRRVTEELERRIIGRAEEPARGNDQLCGEAELRNQVGIPRGLAEGGLLDLVEASRDVVWRVDSDRNLTYVSPGITDLLGYSVEEFLALNPLNTLTPASRQRVLEIVRDELATQDATSRSSALPRTERLEHYRKDGSTVWVEATGAFLRDRDGSLHGMLGVSRDITERKHIEDLKSDFVAMVGHELRTPLTSIRGYSELLLVSDNLTPEERREFLVNINRQSVVVADLVTDMLDIARMESGRDLILRREPCDVSDQIRRLVATYRNQSRAHVFEVVLPDCPVVLLVDEQRMADVFDNLLSNAVKYSPKGGIIRVTCRLTEYGCSVAVEDQGIGMTPWQVRHVFDKFYRADHSNTAMRGMGVGMTTVKNVIEAQGGKVLVESAVGKGTTVTFTLPMAGATILEGGDTVEKNTRSG